MGGESGPALPNSVKRSLTAALGHPIVKQSLTEPPMPTPNLNCSFCLKHAREVRKLIAGASGYICDGCVALCNDILTGEDKPRPFSTGAA